MMKFIDECCKNIGLYMPAASLPEVMFLTQGKPCRGAYKYGVSSIQRKLGINTTGPNKLKL